MDVASFLCVHVYQGLQASIVTFADSLKFPFAIFVANEFCSLYCGFRREVFLEVVGAKFFVSFLVRDSDRRFAYIAKCYAIFIAMINGDTENNFLNLWTHF